MNRKMPNTPFSTRLSGSSKELELRLRSIFRWKKKRPPVALFALAVAVLLSCFGLFSCVPKETESAADDDPIEENTGMAAYDTVVQADFLAEIGKTLVQVMEENPGIEYRAAPIPDASGQCLWRDGDRFYYYFFGTLDAPGLSDLAAEYGAQLKCAGAFTTVGELYPDMTEDMPLEQFFAQYGITEYTHTLEAQPDQGWISFYDGVLHVWIDTNDDKRGLEEYVPTTVMKCAYPVLVSDEAIEIENGAIRDASQPSWSRYTATTSPAEPHLIESTTSDETVYPVIRYEGDGWHIDIPEGWSYTAAWNRWDSPDAEVYVEVQLCTGSIEYIKAYYAELGAWRCDTDMEAPYDYYYLLNPLEVNSTGLHQEAFFVPPTEDTCYTIFCTWVKNGKTAEEQELLHTIAASFTTDGTVSAEVAQTQLLRRASFEGTRFLFDGIEYDVVDVNENINAINDYYEIGNYIVVECHAGPQNNVYLVFDTNTGTFEKEMIGTNLVWRGDDISTAVYSFWNDIYDYEGNVLYTVSMEEASYIHALAFADDHSAIMVVIRNQADGTTREEFIEFGS